MQGYILELNQTPGSFPLLPKRRLQPLQVPLEIHPMFRAVAKGAVEVWGYIQWAQCKVEWVYHMSRNSNDQRVSRRLAFWSFATSPGQKSAIGSSPEEVLLDIVR